MGDYIPTNDAEFNNWQTNLIDVVSANAESWGIPADTVIAVKAKQTTWVGAYAKASNKQNRTQADVIAKKDAEEDYSKTLRALVQQW